MEVRFLSEADYVILTTWWDFWRFPAPPEDMLPENGKGGLMVNFEDQHICAGFIYPTNSKICWIEFVVSNYEVKDRELRKKGIKFLLDSLTELAKQNGFKYIFSSIKHESLINSYLDCGFQKGGENCTELIKLI